MKKRTFVVVAVSVALFTGIASPVFAQTQEQQKAPPICLSCDPQPAALMCVQTAVDARETAVAEAFSQFVPVLVSALSARKAALHQAWGTSDADARRAARKLAWENYYTESKKAHATLREARVAIWNIFREESKKCGVPVVEQLRSLGTISL